MRTLKKLGLIGAIVGAGLVGEGCETTEGNLLLGTFLQSSDDPRAQTMGNMYSTVGQYEAQKEIAREGATRVEVNVGGGERSYDQPIQRQTKSDHPMIITTTISSSDYDYQTALKNQKSIFHSGEEICLWADLDQMCKYFPVGSFLANKNIHIATGSSDFVEKKEDINPRATFDVSFDASYLATNIGEGEYQNIWYVKINGEWKEAGRVNYAVFK